MRIVTAGASGFLGRNLRQRLAEHDVVQLVRRRPADAGQREWHPERGELDPSVLEGADAVINLTGAGVEDKRWNAAYRRVLVDSRVQPSATLARTMAAMAPERRPRSLLNASAIGFYGDTGDTAVDESSPPGNDFFGRMCQQWERATDPARDAGVRVVNLRTGLILDSGGGLLRPIVLSFQLGVGGKLAGGRQWMPCMSVDDWCSAVKFLLARDDIAGPVNVVGTEPVRNADFTKALGRILHRPTIVPIPRFALRIVLGPFADEGAVTSSRVLPAVLKRTGFTYAHGDLDSVLRAALKRR